MEKPHRAEEAQLLRQLLLDRYDPTADIALACLRENQKSRTSAVQRGIHGNERLDLRDCELEVIRWVAAGKTYRDIAAILSIPYGTVRYHLNRARRRNRFETVIQLIVRAAHDFDLNPLTG